jgi:hypothetical protein
MCVQVCRRVDKWQDERVAATYCGEPMLRAGRSSEQAAANEECQADGTGAAQAATLRQALSPTWLSMS